MSVLEQTTKQVESLLLAAIEARAKDLAEAGYTKDDVSIRSDGRETVIFIHNVADSKFYIETVGLTISVKGVSMR